MALSSHLFGTARRLLVALFCACMTLVGVTLPVSQCVILAEVSPPEGYRAHRSL